MAITSKQKDSLNLLAKSQPALNDAEKPFPESALKLGDLISEMQSEIDSLKAAVSSLEDRVELLELNAP